jgi:hypothetical protein
LQAWLAAATRSAGGRLPAAGLVALGLLPLVALVGNLASRFDAGVAIWHDLLLMLADGQIGTVLPLLGCLLAGSGVAIVALAGRPPRPAPDMRIDGEISVRRQPPPAAPEAEPPEPDEETDSEEEPDSAQPEPERDPRLWSKPLGWISPPPGRRSATPRPSVT